MHETHEQAAVGSAGSAPVASAVPAGSTAQAGERQEYITLTQAARLMPNRPSINCVWRWARKGVLARNGQRIRLEHVRLGGKLFTTAAWMAQFGVALAKADVDYFAHDSATGLRDDASIRGNGTPAPAQAVRPCTPVFQRNPRRHTPATRTPEQRQAAVERAMKALKAVGL